MSCVFPSLSVGPAAAVITWACSPLRYSDRVSVGELREQTESNKEGQIHEGVAVVYTMDVTEMRQMVLWLQPSELVLTSFCVFACKMAPHGLCLCLLCELQLFLSGVTEIRVYGSHPSLSIVFQDASGRSQFGSFQPALFCITGLLIFFINIHFF